MSLHLDLHLHLEMHLHPQKHLHREMHFQRDRVHAAPETVKTQDADFRPMPTTPPGWGKNYSATGSGTRVARVRAEYPNQLDYSGWWLIAAWQSRRPDLKWCFGGGPLFRGAGVFQEQAAPPKESES